VTLVRRHAEIENDQMPGQDSFLDVITNIVGILILLVVIVGVRSSQARLHKASEQSTLPSSAGLDGVEEARVAAKDAERRVAQSVQQMLDTNQETTLREKERTILQTMVLRGEAEIAERRAKLNSEDQRNFDLRRELNETQFKLDELTRQQMALLAHEEVAGEIECQPTPLGRVVTGDETHVLLADDHIAVVPLKELTDEMFEDAKKNFWRLKNENVMERTIGPFAGFRVHYIFVKSEVIARGQSGTVVAGQFPQFKGCEFLPVVTPMGEPANEALRQGSEFQQFLSTLSPQRTTMTIWTYPGNYDRLLEFKRQLRERGFQIAMRPLPPGEPIGGSPSGTQSVAE
jgi:hypothetical protein